MKNFTEFKSKFESDAAFREKFKGVKDKTELLTLAKANGYDLEKLASDELDDVSGGRLSQRKGMTDEEFVDWHFWRSMF